MFRNLPPITLTLLLLNGGFFLLTELLKSVGIELTMVLGSFSPITTNFHLWQPLTHLFMHGGVSHLLFNLLALTIFGAAVERTLGKRAFLLLYFLSGLGAWILYNSELLYPLLTAKRAVSAAGYDPDMIGELLTLDYKGHFIHQYIPNVPAVIEYSEYALRHIVGASGAIYGLLAAYGLLYPRHKLIFIFLPFPIEARYLIPGIMVLEIILGFLDLSWNPVAHFAHLGGALTGALLLLYWRWKQRKRHSW